MSWEGNYFGRGGSIWKAWGQALRLTLMRQFRAAAMSLVSPHYSRAGTLRARNGYISFGVFLHSVIAALSANLVYRQRGEYSLSIAEWSTLLPALRVPIFGDLATASEVKVAVDGLLRTDTFKSSASHDRSLILCEVCKALVREGRIQEADEYFSSAQTIMRLNMGKMPVGQHARLLRFVIWYHCKTGDPDLAQTVLTENWPHIVAGGVDQVRKAEREFKELGLVVSA